MRCGPQPFGSVELLGRFTVRVGGCIVLRRTPPRGNAPPPGPRTDTESPRQTTLRWPTGVPEQGPCNSFKIGQAVHTFAPKWSLTSRNRAKIDATGRLLTLELSFLVKRCAVGANLRPTLNRERRFRSTIVESCVCQRWKTRKSRGVETSRQSLQLLDLCSPGGSLFG